MRNDLNKVGKNGLPLFRKLTDIHYNLDGSVKLTYQDVEVTPNDNEIVNEEKFQIISGEEGAIKYSQVRSDFNLDDVDTKANQLILTLP